MSLNLYLNEKVRAAKGFTSKPYSDGSGDDMKFNGMNVFGHRGGLHVMHTEGAPVPTDLIEYIEKVSLYTSVSAECTRRETGIYRYGDAEAEVEISSSSKKPAYSVKLSGKKLEEVYELLRMIKTGTLRPEESYEFQQQGTSRQELEKQLANAERQLEQTRGDLEISRGKVNAAYKLAASFDKRWWQHWPWCSKRTMSAKITLALNGK